MRTPWKKVARLPASEPAGILTPVDLRTESKYLYNPVLVPLDDL